MNQNNITVYDKILIVDFGSQYTQLIARRIRELNVYSEIIPYNKFNNTNLNDYKGIILSGSPFSVNDNNAPQIDINIIKNHNVLGICYGAQLITKLSGGTVAKSSIREYGRAKINIKKENNIFNSLTQNSDVWMSHADTITAIPQNFEIIASTENINIAAFHVKDSSIYGLQFHPEVSHTVEGALIIKNFVFNVCYCNNNWTPYNFINDAVYEIRNTVKNDKVVLGLSGGVDSTVTAMLLNKTIGNNLFCIFVDNGLLRKNEFQNVLTTYKNIGLNVIGVDAKDIFINNLKNITDPEEKRKIIGKTFVDIFDKEAQKIENVKWLAQGTIYPDRIESLSVKGPSATIKSHHNVGGLPENMNLKIIEPLKFLFKDEVRKIGNTLNIPENILNRHPFPGPGLAIRIIGEVTQEKLLILQEADSIFIEILQKHNLYDKIWQAGAILLPIKTVGVMGDERTYENVICLRAVTSVDGMTADWAHIPYNILSEISNTIINKVKGVNRVVYDISSKPPATIEWE